MTNKPENTPSISLVPMRPGPALVSAWAKQRDTTGQEHPYQILDRSARAAKARLRGGVSVHAFIEAWTDWAFHFVHSPGRQLELSERARQNAL